MAIEKMERFVCNSHSHYPAIPKHNGDYVLHSVAQANCEELAGALRVIGEATDDRRRPYTGWHPLRKYADSLGIYSDDIADAQDLIPMICKAVLARWDAVKG